MANVYSWIAATDMKRAFLLSAVFACALAASPARATFIIGDVADTKIFFNSGNGVNAFTGNVDKNNTGPLVNFTSVGTVDSANGFANIKPDTGLFTRLTIVP